MKNKVFLKKNVINASVVGFELAGSIVVGFLIGRWIDLNFGTFPVFILFFLFCGCIAGFRFLYKFAKKNISEENELERKEKKSYF